MTRRVSAGRACPEIPAAPGQRDAPTALLARRPQSAALPGADVAGRAGPSPAPAGLSPPPGGRRTARPRPSRLPAPGCRARPSRARLAVGAACAGSELPPAVAAFASAARRRSTASRHRRPARAAPHLGAAGLRRSDADRSRVALFLRARATREPRSCRQPFPRRTRRAPASRAIGARPSTSRGPPRLPDPAGAGQRPAAGLARQRRDDAEAAGGHRPPRRTSTSTRTRTSTAPRTTLAARATDAYEGARETVRRFLDAAVDEEIVFVRGTTEAINLVAKSWGRAEHRPGDEIIVTHLEHHANIVPWQQLAAEKGARLRVDPGGRPRPDPARRVRSGCSARARRWSP